MRKYPDYKYKPRRKPKNISYTPSAGSFHSFNPFSNSLLSNGTAALAAQSNLLLQGGDSFNAANYNSVLNGAQNPLNPINQPAVAAALASLNSTNPNLVNKSHFLLNDYYEQLQQQMQRQQTADFPANVDYNSLLKSFPMFPGCGQGQQLSNMQMLCTNAATPAVSSNVTVTSQSNQQMNLANAARMAGQQTNQQTNQQMNQQINQQINANLPDPVSLFYSMQQQFAGNLLNLANSNQLTNLTNKFTIDNLIGESKGQLKPQSEIDRHSTGSKTDAKEERRAASKLANSKDGEETECEEDQEIENYENKSLN